MASQARLVQDFVDAVHSDKFKDFPDKNNITLEEKLKLSMRLDHQGMNKDGTHRIWIQPLGGGGKTQGKGKSRTVRMGNKNVVARAHVEDGVPPQDVRDALVKSARNQRKIILLKVGAAPKILDEE